MKYVETLPDPSAEQTEAFEELEDDGTYEFIAKGFYNSFLELLDDPEIFLENHLTTKEAKREAHLF